MLNFLFPRLTTRAEPDGAAAFAAAARLAREPFFYRKAGVPDTIDGRFAALATVLALALVRLEREGAAGDSLSVAITERFVAMMDAEHREMGLGDPSVGKTVRRLVAALGRRVEIWRAAATGEQDWTGAAEASLPKGVDAAIAAERLQAIWTALKGTDLARLGQGDWR